VALIHLICDRIKDSVDGSCELNNIISDSTNGKESLHKVSDYLLSITVLHDDSDKVVPICSTKPRQKFVDNITHRPLCLRGE